MSTKKLSDTTGTITPLTNTMGHYWGLDVSGYPGDAKMQDWWTNSPCYFTGFYLAPAPYHSDTSWMSKRSTLVSQGWGFLPLYVGRQAASSYLTSAQGTTDANNAISLMQQAGFPSGFPNQTYIYLDVEQGGLLSSNFITYIKAWVAQIQANGLYLPGIYCSYSQTADQIKNAINSSGVRFYVFHLTYNASNSFVGTAPDPSGSGVSYATTWQVCQNISKTFGSSTINPVDADASIYSDPSDPNVLV